MPLTCSSAKGSTAPVTCTYRTSLSVACQLDFVLSSLLTSHLSRLHFSNPWSSLLSRMPTAHIKIQTGTPLACSPYLPSLFCLYPLRMPGDFLVPFWGCSMKTSVSVLPVLSQLQGEAPAPLSRSSANEIPPLMSLRLLPPTPSSSFPPQQLYPLSPSLYV